LDGSNASSLLEEKKKQSIILNKFLIKALLIIILKNDKTFGFADTSLPSCQDPTRSRSC